MIVLFVSYTVAKPLQCCISIRCVCLWRRRLWYNADFFHRAKTRIQAATSDSKKGSKKAQLSMLSMLLRILKEEGIVGWYKGFAATMLNTFSMRM